MIKKSYEMNCVLANIFVGMIHENDLPVTMKVGKSFVDANNERMVSVDCAFPESDQGIVERVLGWAMEKAVNRVCGNSYRMEVI